MPYSTLVGSDDLFITKQVARKGPRPLDGLAEHFNDLHISPGNVREVSHPDDARIADCNSRHSGAP